MTVGTGGQSPSPQYLANPKKLKELKNDDI